MVLTISSILTPTALGRHMLLIPVFHLSTQFLDTSLLGYNLFPDDPKLYLKGFMYICPHFNNSNQGPTRQGAHLHVHGSTGKSNFLQISHI